MLYLQRHADIAAHSSSRASISEKTALHLERALLAGDRALRQRELTAALADDGDLRAWALRAAEFRLGRTINRLEEAAEWLCDSLEFELASSLVTDEAPPSSDGVEWRLPALLQKLTNCRRESENLRARLEREKLESLKELAYGASHEINNPLANIASRAQTLLADEHDAERRRKLVTIYRQAMRAHEMIADLMLFSRPPKLNPSPCNMQQIASRVVDEQREMAQEYSVELEFEPCNETVTALADETQIGVAIQALVRNALEAVGQGGHVWVAIRPIEASADRCVEIAVRDDGPGISDEVRQHMFDPFYSGREAGRGLGFGLSKCWRIVTDHGGQVVVQRSASVGAEIVIQLPAAHSFSLEPATTAPFDQSPLAPG
jgi:signal transduction histidine kinase